ncbi:MAG: ArnT family glycosyltransferase [Gammaproteobacteria bacterium]
MQFVDFQLSPRKNRVIAMFSAAVLIVAAGIYLFQNLAKGEDLSYDEFYSLERSHGFEKFDDWLSVYSLNKPTARKPPLQYWLNALSMKLGMSDILAVRFWSYIFYLGLSIATAWMCHYLNQDNPWVIPASVLMIFSSHQLTRLAQSGYLDSGMSFFMMSSMVALCYAKQNPKLWILCGVLAGLGALQKVPVALLFLGIMLYILNKKQDEYYRWSLLRQNKFFNCGLVIATILFLIWPILQSFKYGIYYIDFAYQKEMFDRFSPFRKEAYSNSGAWDWFGWLWSDWHVFSIVACVCAASAIIFQRWRKDYLFYSLAVLACLTVIAFTLASGKIYSRYLAVLSPLLICVTIKVVSDLLPWKPSLLIIISIVFVLSFSNSQRVDAKNKRSWNYSTMKELVSSIDRYRKDSDYVMINRLLIPAGAYGYFGSSNRVFSYYTRLFDRRFNSFMRILEENKHTSSIIGIARTSEISILTHVLGNVEELDAKGKFIIWRYTPPTAALGLGN